MKVTQTQSVPLVVETVTERPMCNKNQFSVCMLLLLWFINMQLQVVNSVWEGTYLSGESILINV